MMTSPLPQPWFTEAFLWEFLCQQGPIETFSSSPNQRRSIGALPFPNGSGSRIDHLPFFARGEIQKVGRNVRPSGHWPVHRNY